MFPHGYLVESKLFKVACYINGMKAQYIYIGLICVVALSFLAAYRAYNIMYAKPAIQEQLPADIKVVQMRASFSPQQEQIVRVWTKSYIYGLPPWEFLK